MKIFGKKALCWLHNKVEIDIFCILTLMLLVLGHLALQNYIWVHDDNSNVQLNFLIMELKKKDMTSSSSSSRVWVKTQKVFCIFFVSRNLLEIFHFFSMKNLCLASENSTRYEEFFYSDNVLKGKKKHIVCMILSFVGACLWNWEHEITPSQ